METCEVLMWRCRTSSEAAEATRDLFSIRVMHHCWAQPVLITLTVSLWWRVFKSQLSSTLSGFVTKKKNKLCLRVCTSFQVVTTGVMQWKENSSNWQSLAKKWLKRHQNRWIATKWPTWNLDEPTANNICKPNKCEPVLLIGEGCHGNTLLLDVHCKNCAASSPPDIFQSRQKYSMTLSLSKSYVSQHERVWKCILCLSPSVHESWVLRPTHRCRFEAGQPVSHQCAARWLVLGWGGGHASDSDITLSHVWAFNWTTLRGRVWK